QLLILFVFLVLFFFQAEDGIRDFHVTGVQTCALPISEIYKIVDVKMNKSYNSIWDDYKYMINYKDGDDMSKCKIDRDLFDEVCEIGRASCRERVWISVVAV